MLCPVWQAYDEEEEVARQMRKQADAMGVKEEPAAAAAKGTDRKRALSPSGDIDRSKLQKVAEAAAARGGAIAAVQVQEKDVVMLLHKKRQMTLKELVQAFKEHNTTKESKAEFIQLVLRVAYKFTENDATGNPVNMIKLKDSTLVKYQLD